MSADTASRHVRGRESDPYDYRLTDPRFRCTCSCGWQAPGWFGDENSAFVEWYQHVREAKANGEDGSSDER